MVGPDTSGLYQWVEIFYDSLPWWRKLLARLPVEQWKVRKDEYDEWVASRLAPHQSN